MAGTISVELKGLNELQAVFSKVDAAFNVTDVLDQAGAIILARIRQRFLIQQAPDGSTWPESQAAKDRKASGRDGGTLFDTGTLFHSIQLHTEGDDARAITAAAQNKAGQYYGYFLQWGTVHLPPRVFLAFNEDDQHVLELFLEKRFNEAFS